VRENESPFSAASQAEVPGPRRGRRRAEGEDKRARRSERTADKRERILKAAIKVFARKGFYAARVSEIAKAAGVADGTIYLYFRNKDDVLTSVFESRITRLVEVLREIVGGGGSFEERFTRIVELQLGVLDGRRDLAEVVTVNLRQSSKLLKQFAAPFFVQYLEVMAGLIAEAQREGTVRDDVSPRLVARSLWGAIDGIALTWAIGGGEVGQLARAAPQVASLFLEGLRARSELRAIPRTIAARGASDDA
jgi:TetR/AcrR family fatty acid metabolism transcriptional regulator